MRDNVDILDWYALLWLNTWVTVAFCQRYGWKFWHFSVRCLRLPGDQPAGPCYFTVFSGAFISWWREWYFSCDWLSWCLFMIFHICLQCALLFFIFFLCQKECDICSRCQSQPLKLSMLCFSYRTNEPTLQRERFSHRRKFIYFQHAGIKQFVSHIIGHFA